VWKPAGKAAMDAQMARATSSGSTRIEFGPQNGV
jgi:hypothetical protein